MDEATNDKRVLDLFTKHSHHQNVTVLYLCQDMFPVGKYAKSISRNAHYIVAFKNPRDQLGVRNVLLRSFPTTWKDSLETFHLATTRPYGYLVLDLHPASSDTQRLLSHLLKEEGWTRYYQKRPDTPQEEEEEDDPSRKKNEEVDGYVGVTRPCFGIVSKRSWNVIFGQRWMQIVWIGHRCTWCIN